jgi:hypothetical protein
MKKKPVLGSAKAKEETKADPSEDIDMVKAPEPPKRKFGEAPAKRVPAAAPKPTAGSTSAKPLTGGGSGGMKKPAAPQVEEADLGEGLSKEEAVEKVQEFYSADAMKNFDK